MTDRRLGERSLFLLQALKGSLLEIAFRTNTLVERSIA